MMSKKSYLVGLVCGVVLATGTGAMASTTKISAMLQNVTFDFNGQKSTYQAIGYDGHLYVPVRFMGESIGSNVSWNGDTNTVGVVVPYEPPAKTGSVNYIGNMHTLTEQSYMGSQVSSVTDNLGGVFGMGGVRVTATHYWIYDVTYYLAGDYSQLKGVLVPTKEWTSKPHSDDIGHLEILADGKTVYNSGAIPSELTKPISVDASLKDVSKLEIKLIGGDASDFAYLAFANVQFLK